MNCFQYHIKNAFLVKGDGSEPVKSELLCSNDGKILAVGHDFVGCGKVLDGRKQLLVPGFIDAHSHSDISVLPQGSGISKLSQGVTTDIVGNCGLSVFPLTGKNRGHLEELYANYQYPFQWQTCAEYLSFLQEKMTVPRIVPLCGHNTLRAAAAGYDKEQLSRNELQIMIELLDEALTSGAMGLSFGLLYVPGKFARQDEITELMKTVARHDKICTTHLRSEGNELLESIEEFLFCAKSAGLKKLQISHFKTAGKQNWSKLDAAEELILKARNEGITLTLDRYPYTESMTQLSVVLPGKWSDMDDSKIQKLLQDREERELLTTQLAAAREKESWKNVRLCSTAHPRYRKDCGRIFTEITTDPVALAVELLSVDCTGTCAAFAGMSEENLSRIISWDFCMPGSDGNALPPGNAFGTPHPRSWGTFPRFLKRLLESGTSIREAFFRASGLPARTFGLNDRGVLEPGRMADMVLIDPDALEDKATFLAPDSPAEGILWTMVGGKLVFQR